MSYVLIIFHLFDDFARNVEPVGKGVVHDGECQFLNPELINFRVALRKLLTQDLCHRVRLVMVDQHLRIK
jgi:hypothetical protein